MGMNVFGRAWQEFGDRAEWSLVSTSECVKRLPELVASAPNTSLHRTPAAAPPSPVSSKPLGDAKRQLTVVLLLGILVLVPIACSASGASASCRDAVAPVLLNSPGPKVPGTFWQTHEAGKVVLQVWVETDGRVTFQRVVKTSGAEYSDLAAQAVRSWRYKPATCGGQPTRTDLTISMS